jgi:hypothetical protein
MATTKRLKGHMPTVGFYLPEWIRPGTESIFVRGFGATSPDRTDGSWIVTLSEPAGAYMAATAVEAAFLFDNLDRCCIHAAPCFGDIGPGQASTTVSRLYLARGSLEDFLKRHDADRDALAAQQKWARPRTPAGGATQGAVQSQAAGVTGHTVMAEGKPPAGRWKCAPTNMHFIGMWNDFVRSGYSSNARRRAGITP